MFNIREKVCDYQYVLWPWFLNNGSCVQYNSAKYPSCVFIMTHWRFWLWRHFRTGKYIAPLRKQNRVFSSLENGAFFAILHCFTASLEGTVSIFQCTKMLNIITFSYLCCWNVTSSPQLPFHFFRPTISKDPFLVVTYIVPYIPNLSFLAPGFLLCKLSVIYR